MQIIKYILLIIVFLISNKIGRMLSQRYKERVDELEEIKNAIQIFKTKIKYTYDPIPEIFTDISKNSRNNIGQIFKSAVEKMKNKSAGIAWEEALDENKENTNLKEEDIEILKRLSKLLGMIDAEGQISQIEITNQFLEEQIVIAREEKQKNQKLYQKLGTTMGLVIVILLI